MIMTIPKQTLDVVDEKQYAMVTETFKLKIDRKS
jgi:hypothetical protein